MKIMEFNAVPDGHYKASSVTIGNFDGVHLGHRAIVGRAIGHGRALDVPSVVITFDPHPREVLSPGKKVPAIIPFSERARLISEMGASLIVKVEFTREFAERTADEFLVDLQRKLNPKMIVIGHDFRFGKGREGDEAFLTEAGKNRGFAVESVPAVLIRNKPVSSTRIRSLIQAGNLRRAKSLLGEPFHVEGRVVKGRGRGKDLGFATANLKWEAELIPPDGVYAAVAHWNGHRYPAVVNIGDNPTFGDGTLAIEAHVMGFEGDLYQKDLRLAFYYRIRGEIKFKSPKALVSQIKKDVIKAREILAEEAGEDLFLNIANPFEALEESSG